MILLESFEAHDFKALRRVSLRFPERCAVLVEGLNESGKSTLFEAIYFALYGEPLVTSGQRGSYDDAINHDADEARVRLTVLVGEIELRIGRVLRRGRPNRAELVVARPGAPDERISGPAAVRARVLKELNGLDGDALRNSCFVEQKKLSRLEELGRAERQRSFERLLNLEALGEAADALRPGDEAELELARARLQLARVRAAIPRLEAEVDGASAPKPAERELAARAGGAGSTPATDDLWDPEPADELLDPEPPAPGPSSEGLEDERGALQPAPLRSVAAPLLLGIAALAAGAFALGAGAPLPGVALLLVGLALAGLGSRRVLDRSTYGVAEPTRTGSHEPATSPFPEAPRAGPNRALLIDLGRLQGERERLEAAYPGLAGADLDEAECAAELATLERDRLVRRRALELIEGTRRRVLGRVLPRTERNLGLLLPHLTDGRYREARLSEDYHLEVWDETARRYVAKDLFSGGTRDQLSLALRLAFALATLPEERGAAPGFLFLDEPLSSFDARRASALVDLLTRGVIARHFPQVFVISHRHTFDADAFSHRILMADGALVERNLPSAEAPSPPVRRRAATTPDSVATAP